MLANHCGNQVGDVVQLYTRRVVLARVHSESVDYVSPCLATEATDLTEARCTRRHLDE